MLLVIKLAAVVGLVASSANWLALDSDSKSGHEARQNARAHQAVFHETVTPAPHNSAQMPLNVCLNGCNFLSLFSSAH